MRVAMPSAVSPLGKVVSRWKTEGLRATGTHLLTRTRGEVRGLGVELLRPLGVHHRAKVHGFGDAAEYLATRWAISILSSGFHKATMPSLQSMYEAALSVHTSAMTLIREHLLPPDAETELRCILDEYGALKRELESRYQSGATHLSSPPNWAAEDSTCLLLYVLVRTRRPSVALETGVANGHSTFFILNAMAKNGQGTLHSVDITPDVGGLLREEERGSWHLHVLDGSKECFSALVDSLPSLDLFIHDSDHSYQWQSYEHSCAYKKMAARPVMVTDDSDSSFAFLDFCRSVSARPVFLIDRRKVTGILLAESYS